ncbi:MAG: T9SS type A sorting domain-containing protein [Bacteroidia bacterium]|nr:T9SS type A sorting domain-containing protein [Bacteroidia bacterium]
MKSISRLLLICCISLFSNFSFSQCDWETVGLDDDLFFITDSSATWTPAITSDNNGTQYIAFSDGDNQGKVTVKRFVNGYWTVLGQPGISGGKADYIKIASDNLNRVYVAYQDFANGKKITVKYFNGFNWVGIGSAGFSPIGISDLDIAVNGSNNLPYVVYADTVNNISVQYFNGTSWNGVGAVNFSGDKVYYPEIEIGTGMPVVSYVAVTTSQMNVQQFNGTAWNILGNLAATPGGGLTLSLNNANVPHVAFSGNPAGQANVMFYNGTSWNYLGLPNISTNNAIYIKLKFDLSNNAYLAYWNLNGGVQTGQLAKYNGSSWSVLGNMSVPNTVSIPSQWARFNGLSVSPVTGAPYMVYTQNNAQPLFGYRDYGVITYNGTSFVNTNETSITDNVSFNTGGYTATFNINSAGVPYVSYTDSVNGNRASVKMFNGINWVYVGAPGFSTSTTEFNSIEFDNTGTPYVSFRENGTSPAVMKYNGSAWVYVGPAAINVAGVGAYTTLAINPVTNEPYIFFCDASLSYKGTVMKYSGGNWINEGAAGFTLGLVSATRIKFDNAGTPYVCYADMSLSGKNIVKKFNGSTWVTVGAGALSTGQVFSQGFAIDAANNLYVAYSDQGNSYRVSVQKFNGTSWSVLGTPLTAGYAGDCDIAVDNGGNVFVYYMEQYLNYYPGTVKRFFNNSWIAAGRQYIHNGKVLNTKIVMNPATNLPFIGSIMEGWFGIGKGYFVKSLPCNFSTALTGNIFYDVNTNCTFNNGEMPLSNMPVKLTQGGTTNMAFSDNMGNYYFTAAPAGTYTVGLGNLQNGYNVSCANSLPHNTTLVTNTLTTENFAVDCTPASDIIAGSISPLGFWWPGQSVSLLTHAYLNNTYCQGPPTPGTIQLVFPPCVKYVADTTLSIQPDSVQVLASGDTVTWNVADVYNPSPYLYNSLIAHAQVCTTAVMGDTLCIQLIVNALNDANLNNNVYARCFVVSAAYDPNYKEVNPPGIGTPGFIPPTTSELYYTIHFQNTGNAPAVNVRIKDTISSNLDISTMQIVSTSHPMQLDFIAADVAQFSFLNIMLPDSGTDMLNSMGYVTYKISLQSGLSPLDEIKNTGYIYFDYNPPIVTNTALNTMDLTTATTLPKKENTLRCYPNPTAGEIFFTQNVKSAEVFDLLGQAHGISFNTNKIKLENLASGVYFIKVIDEKGSRVTFKVVKNN